MMVKTKTKYLLSLTPAIGLAFNLACGEYNSLDDDNFNSPPNIITQSLDDAVAGEYYTQKLNVLNKDRYNIKLTLEKAPEEMTLKDNKLKWSPPFSTNLNLPDSQGEYKVELSLTDEQNTTTKQFNLMVKNNPDPYTYTNNSLEFLITNNDIRLVSESEYPFNETNPVKKFNDFTSIVKKLKNITGSDAPESYKPVEVHLNTDNSCTSNYASGQILFSLTEEGAKYYICIYSDRFNKNYKEFTQKGNLIHEYSEAIFREHIKDIDDIIPEQFGSMHSTVGSFFLECSSDFEEEVI